MLETTSKEFDLSHLLKDLPQKIKKLEKFKKLVLTDAVLLGEIPLRHSTKKTESD